MPSGSTDSLNSSQSMFAIESWITTSSRACGVARKDRGANDRVPVRSREQCGRFRAGISPPGICNTRSASVSRRSPPLQSISSDRARAHACDGDAGVGVGGDHQAARYECRALAVGELEIAAGSGWVPSTRSAVPVVVTVNQ